MNASRLILHLILFIGALIPLRAGYLGPDGNTYNYKTVNWIKKYGEERAYNHVSYDNHGYDNYSYTHTGIAFFGPSDPSYFSETYSTHYLGYEYDHDIQVYFEHWDTSVKRQPTKVTHRESGSGWNYYPAQDELTPIPFTNPPVRIVEGTYTPQWVPEIPIGTTIIGNGSITVISPPPTAYYPLNWADIDGSGFSEYISFSGMVTYSNTPPEISKYIDFDASDDGSGDEGDPGFDGETPNIPVIGAKPSIAIGDYIVPEGSSYGTCNSSLNIRLETPQQKPMLSSWRCKSATSNDTGLTIPSSAYSFAVTGTGATFTTTTTESGVYEIEVKTMFGANNFIIVTNAPQFESVEIAVGLFETGQTLEVDPSGYANIWLDPGIYHFQMSLLNPGFGDYRLITTPHWVTENAYGMGSFSSRLVDDNWNPDPNGGIIEVTITGSGLFGISAFATCPELPNANSPVTMIDISSEVE